ncbi:MAG: S-methyl-5-thioadenosine phosphorylase, partial [Acidimicrobiaceae bacterium]|nr:S-methyl-5-thioadenosine phosphorylase [Acidimicrobiaceae bacterium]
MSPTTPTATIGIIGGSGFYSLFDDPSVHDVETPYGAPSAPVTIGSLGGTSVAFIPRHGLHHEFAP